MLSDNPLDIPLLRSQPHWGRVEQQCYPLPKPARLQIQEPSTKDSKLNQTIRKLSSCCLVPHWKGSVFLQALVTFAGLSPAVLWFIPTPCYCCSLPDLPYLGSSKYVFTFIQMLERGSTTLKLQKSDPIFFFSFQRVSKMLFLLFVVDACSGVLSCIWSKQWLYWKIIGHGISHIPFIYLFIHSFIYLKGISKIF